MLWLRDMDMIFAPLVGSNTELENSVSRLPCGVLSRS